MNEPEAPYGPGAICDDCGHFAGSHSKGLCKFPPESRFEPNKGKPCPCGGLLWLGYRWDIPYTGFPVRAGGAS